MQIEAGIDLDLPGRDLAHHAALELRQRRLARGG
jgi:hypothetical protein